MSNQFPIIEVFSETNEATEEIGSKSKFWFQHEDWGLSLFKKARQNTGEDWSEKVAAELCQLLRLPHASYELAVCNGERGVVSPSFLPNTASLVLGNEILFKLVPNYPENENSPSEHTLSQVLSVIGETSLGIPLDWNPIDGISTPAEVFIGYLMLDAWIGNTDRHHQNWGKVVSSKGVYLAPTYDHASSLGRELLDQKRQERLSTNDKGFNVEAFAKKGPSCLYREVKDKNPMKLDEAFLGAAKIYPDAAQVWLRALAEVSSGQIRTVFNKIPAHRTSKPAIDFALALLEINQKRLLNLNFT